MLEVRALQEPGPAVFGREVLEAQFELVFQFFGLLVGGDAEFVESEFFVTAGVVHVFYVRGEVDGCQKRVLGGRERGKK